MAPAPALTPPRRAVAAALLFLASGALAGVALLPAGTEYRLAGLTEGVFGLFLTWVLLARAAWLRPAGPLGWLAVGYGAWANVQLLELLFPPPGVLEWVVVTALALTSWAALGAAPRERLIAALATLALLLALLKFSIIPVLWERAGPDPGTAFGLGDLAEGVRRLVADHRPVRRAGQLVGVLALALWALGTRLLWTDGVPPAAQDGAPGSSPAPPALRPPDRE